MVKAWSDVLTVLPPWLILYAWGEPANRQPCANHWFLNPFLIRLSFPHNPNKQYIKWAFRLTFSVSLNRQTIHRIGGLFVYLNFIYALIKTSIACLCYLFSIKILISNCSFTRIPYIFADFQVLSSFTLKTSSIAFFGIFISIF